MLNVPFKLVDVPIRDITDSPLHFEREHTQESVDKMADSINEVGMINPPSLRKKGRMYELLAGKRRLQAAITSGAHVLSCKVYTCDDYTAELLSIKENVDGTDPLSPKELKRAVDRIVDLTQQQIGTRDDDPDEVLPSRGDDGGKPSKAGKSRSNKNPEDSAEHEGRKKAAELLDVSETTVSRLRHLDKLSKTVRRAYENKQISAMQAEKLSKYPLKKQLELLPKMIRESQSETVARESVEKLTDTKDYRVAVKVFDRLKKRCDEATDQSRAIIKCLSPELVAHIKDAGIAELTTLRSVLKRLLAHVADTEKWARRSRDN
jgi:ParB-like chromosome segregation protein Spo0J